MNVSEREIIKKVRQWITYGNDDLHVARHVLTLSDYTPYRLIAYHAQQCMDELKIKTKWVVGN